MTKLKANWEKVKKERHEASIAETFKVLAEITSKLQDRGAKSQLTLASIEENQRILIMLKDINSVLTIK